MGEREERVLKAGQRRFVTLCENRRNGDKEEEDDDDEVLFRVFASSSTIINLRIPRVSPQFTRYSGVPSMTGVKM